jgi:hypothetical protein
MFEEFETLLVITQRDTTTELAPLPTGNVMTLTVQGGLPGPAAEGSQNYDPGDLTVIFRNGLV